jgi:hypothetical protein
VIVMGIYQMSCSWRDDCHSVFGTLERSGDGLKIVKSQKCHWDCSERLRGSSPQSSLRIPFPCIRLYNAFQ